MSGFLAEAPGPLRETYILINCFLRNEIYCINALLLPVWSRLHTLLMFSRRMLQGYLAHKKQPTSLGPPQGPRHSPDVGS